MVQNEDKVRNEALKKFINTLTFEGVVRKNDTYVNEHNVKFCVYEGLLYKVNDEDMPDYPIAVMSKSVTEAEMENR